MKQDKRRPAIAAIALFVAGAALPALASPMLDGATIVTSGSTNTAGYTLKVRSNGAGEMTVENNPAKPFTIDPTVAKKFLADAKAARANPGTPQQCMKSASFGTTTHVTWHDYTSGDLQCPPFSTDVATLANDVSAIRQAAGVLGPIHRIRLPIDQRRLPETTPSMSPRP